MPSQQNELKAVPKRPRGRPATLVMPPSIPDTPTNIARSCMQGPPKKDWRYLKSGYDSKKAKE